MGKGIQAERDLSDILEDQYGYAALRSPGSGGRTERARPDLLAVKTYEVVHKEADLVRPSWDVHVVELKSEPDGTATYDREEVEQLEEYAERAGAFPWLAVKPDLRSHDQWYFIPTNEAHETPEGNYSIRQQDQEDALSIEEVFGPGGV